MKNLIKLLIVFLSFLTLSGCSIFKKKCNCPKMGMEKTEAPVILHDGISHEDMSTAI